jgi:hypothetical protein
MPENSPFIRKLGVRGVIAPMKRPLATGSGSVSQAPLALVDLECDNGVTGCAYVFCFHAFALAPTVRLIQELGALIEGETLAPIALSDMLRARMRLLGQQGLAMMASAGIDMAAWDALAKTRDVPLARLLGGDLMPLPAYNSNGLGIIGAGRAVDEARELVCPRRKSARACWPAWIWSGLRSQFALTTMLATRKSGKARGHRSSWERIAGACMTCRRCWTPALPTSSCRTPARSAVSRAGCAPQGWPTAAA